MTEEIRVGELCFELDETIEGHETVTVTKSGDLEGWVTFVRCGDSDIEWAELRNKCYPLNGREGPPPTGRWVVYEYVGRDGSSLDLVPDISSIGFTNHEIVSITDVVNLIYTEDFKSRTTEIAPKIVTH